LITPDTQKTPHFQSNFRIPKTALNVKSEGGRMETEKLTIHIGDKPYKASWGTVVYRGDADKVAKEINSIGTEFSAQQIVDFAQKRKRSELYKCFEWDDGIAANRYRCEQARSIVRSLKITIINDQEEPEVTPIRYFMMPERKNGQYKKTEIIVQRADEYQTLLATAKAELIAFKNKYSRLSELEEVFEAIDRL